jgi:hypothetical protein
MDLSAIDGEELSSVTFFQESVTLDFGGPSLTLFLWPDVFVPEGAQIGEGSYAYGEPGYRDAMCLQIGEPVETTSFEEGVALEIQFENGTIFRNSLREEDYVGAEAGQFSSGIGGDSLEVF